MGGNHVTLFSSSVARGQVFFTWCQFLMKEKKNLKPNHQGVKEREGIACS